MSIKLTPSKMYVRCSKCGAVYLCKSKVFYAPKICQKCTNSTEKGNKR